MLIAGGFSRPSKTVAMENSLGKTTKTEASCERLGGCSEWDRVGCCWGVTKKGGQVTGCVVCCVTCGHMAGRLMALKSMPMLHLDSPHSKCTRSVGLFSMDCDDGRAGGVRATQASRNG